ncbi:hypothetical protein [Bacterioplanoides sp. SCSIO 12839]|uniref:hypothetical protein n=1 Tax=Bacterioplanoides sp. SCSIO 12839 TaxID=2829569 RepID=UPI002103D44B|nr:hypothetical protein [Bacterioplanoides sp. SCSIO 12839]UTW48683.1 hypothetical protein KFF03_01900 [Bacterioplanoides sp. SCSIO 12839]
MMLKTVFTPERNAVIFRVLAALLPAFVLTNSLGILLVLILPFDRLAVISWASVLGFLFYSVLVMWIFHVSSLKRIWGRLMLAILLTSGISVVLILSGGGL